MRILAGILLLTISCSILACGSSDDDRSFGGGETTNTNPNPAPISTPQPDPGTQSTPQPTATPSNISNVRINRFVWKPASERDGNLVVLVNPTNVRILVTGSASETLANSGSSNGFGTTGRGSFPGCSYGNNIQVEFFDSRGRRILTGGGRSSLSIPRGCDRFEFG